MLEHVYNVGKNAEKPELKIEVAVVKINDEFHCRILTHTLQKGNNSSNFISLSPNELQDIVENDRIDQFFNNGCTICNTPSIKIHDLEITFKDEQKIMRISKMKLEYLHENYVDISYQNWKRIENYYEESMEDLINVMEDDWANIATNLYEELHKKVVKSYLKHSNIEINNKNTRKKLKNIYYKLKCLYKTHSHYTPLCLTILGILISTYYSKLTADAATVITSIKLNRWETLKTLGQQNNS